MTELQHLKDPAPNNPAPNVPAPNDPDQWAWLARLRRPQGRKGEVFADILTDFPEKFAERKNLWLLADPDSPPASARPVRTRPLPQPVELTNHWLHKGGVVLHFAHSQSISDAEALNGLIVAIPREQRAALADDEVYIADLIGCDLIDVSAGTPVLIGRIDEVDRAAGPVALLVVHAAPSTEEILIPFAKSYLRAIDLEARRVEMALPEGLVELNTPSQKTSGAPLDHPDPE
jgi:16S rRNA processing protein RimM